MDNGKQDCPEVLRETIVSSFVREANFEQGNQRDFTGDYLLDTTRLRRFLVSSQPGLAAVLAVDRGSPGGNGFSFFLEHALQERGGVDVLRHGVVFNGKAVSLFLPASWERNLFSFIVRSDPGALPPDLVLLVNGIPISTITVADFPVAKTVANMPRLCEQATNPYQSLFRPGRCLVHFALDDQQVFLCTRSNGKQPCFLPFNKGFHDGAGNPPNPIGKMSDYLWKKILSPKSLSDLVEHYSHPFPRYHQLEAVRQLVSDLQSQGTGKRYLLQHSKGSGKSYSICWLAQQLGQLRFRDTSHFDLVVVLSDRSVLEERLRGHLKEFFPPSSVAGTVHPIAPYQGEIARCMRDQKKVLILPHCSFPHVLGEMRNGCAGKKLAVLLDVERYAQEEAIHRSMQSHPHFPSTSFFAFVAEPGRETLESFGVRSPGMDGKPCFVPFHVYTLTQATQEGFVQVARAKVPPLPDERYGRYYPRA